MASSHNLTFMQEYIYRDRLQDIYRKDHLHQGKNCNNVPVS